VANQLTLFPYWVLEKAISFDVSIITASIVHENSSIPTSSGIVTQVNLYCVGVS